MSIPSPIQNIRQQPKNSNFNFKRDVKQTIIKHNNILQRKPPRVFSINKRNRIRTCYLHSPNGITSPHLSIKTKHNRTPIPCKKGGENTELCYIYDKRTNEPWSIAIGNDLRISKFVASGEPKSRIKGPTEDDKNVDGLFYEEGGYG